MTANHTNGVGWGGLVSFLISCVLLTRWKSSSSLTLVIAGCSPTGSAVFPKGSWLVCDDKHFPGQLGDLRRKHGGARPPQKMLVSMQHRFTLHPLHGLCFMSNSKLLHFYSLVVRYRKHLWALNVNVAECVCVCVRDSVLLHICTVVWGVDISLHLQHASVNF